MKRPRPSTKLGTERVLVVDSSLLVNAFGAHGPLALRARARLAGEELVAPAHVDLEILSAWRRHFRNGFMSLASAEEAIATLQAARLRRLPHAPLLSRIWELRETVTAADAAYVALAEELSAPLATCDARLTKAPGTRCRFELVE